jgi:hypothetical protein
LIEPVSELHIMKNLRLAAALSALALSSTACLEFEHKNSTGPSATGIGALAGTWASTNLIPSPSTCTDFKWNVTEQSTTSARGSFSATCAGDLKLSGTAQGTLTGAAAIEWKAAGNATAPGLASCSINLDGTAVLTTDSIQVPYKGTTCLGAVSGVENMKRR